MKRRSFLALTSGLSLWAATRSLLSGPQASAASDRAGKWAPSTAPLLGVEWRYVAGRIVDGVQDYGFVVAVIDVRVEGNYELLVERQDLGAGDGFLTKSYTGTLSYDTASATYSFRDDQNQLLATWQWDEAGQVYRLTVTTAELTLQDIALRPQGALIAEGGDGVIKVSPIGGMQVISDYYADWTVVEVGGAARGTARLDMQGLRLLSQLANRRKQKDAILTTKTQRHENLMPGRRDGERAPAAGPHHVLTSVAGGSGPAATDFVDHHWFAIAAESAGAPIWISAWRIEDQSGPIWTVTIARGSGGTWQVDSFTEESAAAAPLAIEILRWQPIPQIGDATTPGTSTGATWRIAAGLSQPGDLIDLTVAVPPGQFVATARAYALVGQAAGEEGVGKSAAGTVQGNPLSNVSLAVAETTAEFYLRYLPLTLR